MLHSLSYIFHIHFLWYLAAGVEVHAAFGETGDLRANDINDAEARNVHLLGELQRPQNVARLAALRDAREATMSSGEDFTEEPVRLR